MFSSLTPLGIQPVSPQPLGCWESPTRPQSATLVDLSDEDDVSLLLGREYLDPLIRAELQRIKGYI